MSYTWIMIDQKFFNMAHVFVVVFLLLLLPWTKIVVGVNSGDDNMIKCIERERQALTEFKKGVLDEYGRLSSWGSQRHKMDCCKWRGVRCSNTTGHVIILNLQNRAMFLTSSYQPLKGKISTSLGDLHYLKHLDLSHNEFDGTIPNELGNLTNLRYLNLMNYYNLRVNNLNWISNLPLLRHLDLTGVHLGNINWLEQINKLPLLTELRLQFCGLAGTVSPSLPLSNLSSVPLAVIDLSYNFFTYSSGYNWLFNFSNTLVDIDISSNPLRGTFDDAFGNIKSLAKLNLAGGLLGGEIPMSLRNLRHIQSLELSGNKITGQLPQFFQSLVVHAENSLEILDLSRNHFIGSLPDFTRFLSLRILALDGNKLDGSFPESFAHMSRLIYLDVSQNQMTGSVPDLTLLPSLQMLSVSFNKLSGRLPISIGLLSELETLSASSNSFEDTMSDSHFSNLSNLKTLDLSFNSLTLEFSSDWAPPFQLDVIQLSYCYLGIHFPKWLQSQSNFSKLDISSAGISDEVPKWFWDLSPRLEYLNISHNQINGMVPDLSGKFVGFPMIDLSYNNHLNGPIPLLPPNVTTLNLSNNMFSGPTFVICTIANEFFSYLDLSDNLLSGEFPDCLMHMEGLAILNLANNNFSGKIPSSIGLLYQLQTLHLRNNNFIGELPSSLKKCTNLRVVDLGENKLSGNLPAWIGTHLKSLIVLSLRLNEFNGSISRYICHLNQTQLLDLSHNNISGNIPSCFHNFTSLAQINSSNGKIAFDITAYDGSYYDIGEYVASTMMQWKGKESEYSRNLGLLKGIDLSSNKLVGKIPREFARLEGLVTLNLSRNNLTGNIIPNIDQMKMLESLDLSRNQFSDEIPTGLARLTFLSVLDLSNNNLSGKIPSSIQLQGFNALVYAGNHQLCGLPLLNKCREDETRVVTPSIVHRQNNNAKEDEDKYITLGFYISIFLGFTLGFWGVFGPLVIRRSWRLAYFKFLDRIQDSIYVTAAIYMTRFQRKFTG